MGDILTEYVGWYANQRLHQGLGGSAPNENEGKSSIQAEIRVFTRTDKSVGYFSKHDFELLSSKRQKLCGRLWESSRLWILSFEQSENIGITRG